MALLQTSEPVLQARGLVKVHGAGRGERRILDGVDLDVSAGELVAIVGRSGSGKSTLLQILGGLDRADAGTVAVVGRSVAGSPAPSERQLSALRREEIGFVFQFFHLLAELDGEANVLLPATLPGADHAGMAARGRTLIAQLGLGDVARLRPHQLSGGEQQRFALARALVGDPSLVLADEPIGNLDAAAGEVVLDLLRGVADQGRAVVMVTHQAEATARADRVLRLEDGVLAEAGVAGSAGQVHAAGQGGAGNDRRIGGRECAAREGGSGRIDGQECAAREGGSGRIDGRQSAAGEDGSGRIDGRQPASG